MDSSGVEQAGQCLRTTVTRGLIAFGTKRSWVQIPPPRQPKQQIAAPTHVSRCGDLFGVCVYLRDYRFPSVYDRCGSAPKIPSMTTVPVWICGRIYFRGVHSSALIPSTS